MNKNNANLPLISIVVLTYNSAEFILETLESIYNQNYSGPIEVIITDDASNDDTVNICATWLNKNSNRFRRVKLIQSSENRGITNNANQGLREAKGRWIKIIAGDDLLTNDCIEICTNKAISLGEKGHFISGGIQPFYVGDNGTKHFMPPPYKPSPDHFIDYDFIIENPFQLCIGAAFFMSKSLLDDVNYCDDLFRNIEDYPLFIKCVARGYSLYKMNKTILYYRRHEKSYTQQYMVGDGDITNLLIVSCYDKYLKKTNNRKLYSFWKLLYLRVYLNKKTRFLTGVVYRVSNLIIKYIWGDR